MITKVEYYTTFDAKRWQAKVEDHFRAYVSLFEFIMDDAAIAAHLQTVTDKLERERSKKKNIIPISVQQRWMKTAQEASIVDSFNIFSRQFVVILASFLEGVISDFLRCVFYKHPERMYEFLRSSEGNEHRGKVDLKKILSSEDMEDLLLQLATDASDNATSGKYEFVQKRIVKITKNTITVEELQKTNQINEIRNKIVHESTDIPIDPEFVEKSYHIVLNFIKLLALSSIKMDVPAVVYQDED